MVLQVLLDRINLHQRIIPLVGWHLNYQLPYIDVAYTDIAISIAVYFHSLPTDMFFAYCFLATRLSMKPANDDQAMCLQLYLLTLLVFREPCLFLTTIHDT